MSIVLRDRPTDSLTAEEIHTIETLGYLMLNYDAPEEIFEAVQPLAQPPVLQPLLQHLFEQNDAEMARREYVRFWLDVEAKLNPVYNWETLPRRVIERLGKRPGLEMDENALYQRIHTGYRTILGGLPQSGQ